jgi:transketolase C-terminal domain/subunit
VLREGNGLTLIATGEAGYTALQAARHLEITSGIRATVVSMHPVKPLDEDLLAGVAANGGPVLTVEEHSVYDGPGESCALFLLKNGFRNRFRILGIPDELHRHGFADGDFQPLRPVRNRHCRTGFEVAGVVLKKSLRRCAGPPVRLKFKP